MPAAIHTMPSESDPFTVQVDRLRALSEAPVDCLSEARWSRLLTQELEGFSVQLEQHLADEEDGEADGYMSDVVEQHPEYQRRAQRLLSQHADFMASARSLTEAARQRASLGRVRAGIRQLLDAVEVHEHAENQLVQDAWQIDIGPGD